MSRMKGSNTTSTDVDANKISLRVEAVAGIEKLVKYTEKNSPGQLANKTSPCHFDIFS